MSRTRLAALLLSATVCDRDPAAAARLRVAAVDDSFSARITPYRIEIVQGNVVTSEQAARVKPGMTRLQVRDILGTPLLADPFHADRWDYIFTIRRHGLPNQRRSVVVWFEGDALKTIEAPDLPSERDFVQGDQPCRARRPSRACWSSPRSSARPCPCRPSRPRPRRPSPGAPRAATRRWKRLSMTGASHRVAGASGRMGRMLVEAVLASADCRLAARSTCPAARRWARTPAPSGRHRRGHHRRPAPGWPAPRC
jgi:outer membrane protein assembly factor BamE